jgi:hypothetical protein
MKTFKAQKAYLAGMLMLTFLITSSLAYGGSNEPVNDHQAPGALGAAELFAGIGGAGMANQGMYTVVEEDLDATAAAPLVTGFSDQGAGYTETTATIGTVHGPLHAAHPHCEDTCSL